MQHLSHNSVFQLDHRAPGPPGSGMKYTVEMVTLHSSAETGHVQDSCELQLPAMGL